MRSSLRSVPEITHVSSKNKQTNKQRVSSFLLFSSVFEKILPKARIKGEIWKEEKEEKVIHYVV